MKNFTNSFKQFTSRLSARWLLMALMLLVGTSSAWGYYITGWNGDWNPTQYNMGGSNSYTINNVEVGVYEFKITDGTWDKTWGSGCLSSTTGTTVSKVENGDCGSNAKIEITAKSNVTIKFTCYECYDKGGASIQVSATAVQVEPCADKYYLKHDFGGDGGDWEWKKLTDCDNNIYTLTAIYGGGGCNYSKPNSTDEGGYIASPTLEGPPAKGDECTFTFDATQKTITITKVDQCTAPDAFSISIDETAICSEPGADATITIPNDHSAESYKWCTKNGDTYGEETTIDNKSFTVSTAGTYVVRAYNGNGTCKTESTNAVTLKVDNTITNMFIGLVNPNGGYYNTNPLPLCDDQVTLKAWATGAKTYKVYKTTDLNNPVQTGTVNGDGETNAISYTISKSNLSEGAHGYQVKFENTCGTTTTDTKTVTVPPTPAVPTLPTQGEKFKRESCIDHLQHVNGFAGNGMFYMAVLYEGENVTPTQPTNGTTYDINTNNKIGTGTVKVIQNGNSLAINKLDPKKIYTLAIYRYNTACYEYSEPLTVTIDKNVPILGELTINGNEFSVPVTKIGANESGVDLNVMQFQYYNEAGGNWVEFGYTVVPTYSLQDKEQAGGVITATITPGALTQGKAYQIRACVTNNSCSDLNNYAAFNTNNDITYTVPCSTVAEATLAQNVASVCLNATQTVNLNELAGVNNVNWYKGNNKVADPTQVDIKNAGTTTYVVKAVNGLCESEGVEFTLTVNPLPTISISGSEEAVLYEDVVLTATGVTQGAEVKWYLGNADTPVATGTTYTITSETAGEVIVKAKAFLNGCESDFKEHEVTFGEEVCETGNTKILFSKEHGDYYGFNIAGGIYLYSYNKDTKTEYTGAYPGKEITDTEKINGIDYYVYEFKKNESTDKLAIVIRATYDYGSKIGKTKDIYLNEPGATYTIKLTNGTNATKQDYQETKKGSDTYYDVYIIDDNTTSTGGGIIITAPAAKTISVSTTNGEGNIIFSGQVVKTGCDNTNEYGFQYSSDEQTWTTVKVGENATAGTAIYNNTVNGLDGPFYVRAYITNDNSTQYGAVKSITVSTKKTAITTVTLEHANSDGTLKAETPTYCVGDVVYFKLTHDGSPFSEYDWTTYPGSGLAGYCSNGSGLYHFTLTGSGSIGISLRNDANVVEGNPTWIESNLLEFNTHTEPTAPYISINPASGIICEGSTATIKVENPSTDCSYKLVEEGSKAGFTPYTSGDLTYTVQNVRKYYVVAQHNACTDNEYTSNQVAINQVISTSATISIEPDEEVTTTPWEPVTITVNPQEGYVYELSYTDNNLAGVDGVIIKQNGDSYTYYIPRPDSWGTGDSDSDPDPDRTPINYGIKAQLKVDGEASQCDLNADTATIQLKDEDNEDCTK